MDLIQWDKSALANLMGNTNGNTDWFFGYLNTDQLVPLMDSPTSLAAYQHFAKHCISARLLSMRSINGTTVEKFANIIYSDAGRIFHHRGTLDVPNTNIRKIVPVNAYIENTSEAAWQPNGNPFHLPALLNSDLNIYGLSTTRTAKIAFDFDVPTNITNINSRHAGSSSTRPTRLSVEYKTSSDGEWISGPNVNISDALTTLQTNSLVLNNVLSIRIGFSLSGGAGSSWIINSLFFSTTDDIPKVDEEVKSLVMIPVPNAGHVTPPLWGSGNVRVFAYDVSELKMNRLTTDRFTELGAIMSRLEAKAVVL